ncbi:MAG: helix-turn-helix domain-containing protein [Negativicutes bacterium]|nr:helix-turn-helix domain-containing protein [Negativicutes bacterium]
MGKHTKRTIDEKNQIVEAYLQGRSSTEIIRELELSTSVLTRWVKQYRKYGTTVDGRGRSKNPRGGRSKSLDPDKMSLEELREYVKMMEDIKKATAFLRLQKKNTES